MNVRRGEIFYIRKSGNTGSEQEAGRPAVIVSNEANNMYSSTVEVVYLTTQPKKDMPTHVTVMATGRESTALCEQIFTVSTERIRDYVGICSDEEMADIEDAMMVSLGIAFDDEPVNVLAPETATIGVAEPNTAEIERDIYKRLYETLLDRVMKNG